MQWEGTWGKASKDTEKFRKDSAFWFWGIEVIGVSLFILGGGFLGFSCLPNVSTPSQQFWYPTLGSTVGLIIGLIAIYALIFLWHLSRAPYRQRNELRVKVEELQKPDNKLILREQLADYWEEGFRLQRLCYDLSIPAPDQQIQEWAIKVGVYLDQNMGKDYKTSFIDISTLTSSVLPAPSPERQITFLIVYNGLAHLQQFMQKLRD